MEFQILGIDIAKNKFDCSFIAAPNSPNGRKAKSKVLPNNPTGFAQLIDWLAKNKGSDIKNIKVFMEATGVYHEALAEFLYAQGFAVYVFNPADAAAYIRSDNLHKTNKSDARALADMGIDRLAKGSAGKSLWQPAPPEVKQLKALLARLDALEVDLQREDNRMEKACAVSSPALVVDSIATMQTQLRKQIDGLKSEIDRHIDRHPDLKDDIRLLKSIPGVGEVVSLRMLTLYRSRDFKSASQMAAFVGLVPKKRESGQFKGQSRLSKRGNPLIRAKLYLAAVCATRFNPDIRAHCERLRAKGKTKMQTVGAAMRRLVQICYGVLKHRCEYQAQVMLAV